MVIAGGATTVEPICFTPCKQHVDALRLLRNGLGLARHDECAGRMEALRFVENSDHGLRLLPSYLLVPHEDRTSFARWISTHDCSPAPPNIHSTGSLPKVVWAKGSYLHDVDGKQYIDGSGGPAVYCIGHSNAEVNDAIKAQLDRIAHGYRYNFTSDALEELDRYRPRASAAAR